MLQERIHDAKGQAYCGPTAIAAVTGVPISKIREKIRRARRDKGRDIDNRRIAVKGVHNSWLIEAMRLLGWRVVDKGVASGSLRQWCEDNAHRRGPFIVVAGSHYLAISNGMICDAMTDGKPVPWREHPNWLLKRMERWWEFNGKTKMPADRKPRPPKPPVDHVAIRAKRAREALERLETRAKRIATAIRKRKRQVAYYEKKRAA